MSNTSSSSIASFYTSNGVTRLNGSEFASGLDTQSLIKALTAKTQSKIDKQKQLQQKAEWRQSMYRDVEALMQSFSDSYFSFATGSSTNIMSSAFFDNSALTSSNSIVSATGGAQDAGNVVINSISQLATAASMSSGYQVSNESITSTDPLRNNWVQSAVGGKSFTINYGDKDYTFSMSNSIIIDSSKSTSQNLQTIADGINAQIEATDGLKGKMYFSVDSGTKLKLNMDTATETATIKASGSTTDDQNASKSFLSALGFANNSTTSGGAVTGTSVTVDGTNTLNNVLFNQEIKTGAYLSIKVGSNTYSLSLSGFDLTSSTDNTLAATNIAKELQKQVDANSDLKGKVSFSSAGGTLAISGGTIAGGSSSSFLQGLGIDPNTNSITGNVSKSALTASTIKDALDGSTLTFKLDGVVKRITFNDSESANYSDVSTAAGLDTFKTYLQGKLDAAYGSGKITVSDNSGKISFNASDPTSVLELNSSSSSDVLGEDGALRIDGGETNRTETSKTLKDLAGELNTPLTPSSSKDGINYYNITINGKAFTFDENTELNTVINTINDDTDANVNISYSQTLNEFRITSDDTGAQGNITISDGSLARSMFGYNYSGVTNTVSTNSITLPATSTSTNSVYSFQLGSNSSQTITIPNATYSTIADLQSAIQASINNNSTLNGKVSVGISSDKLTFTTTDGSALTVKSTGTDPSDLLGIGTSGITLQDVNNTKISDLFNHVSGITQNGDGTYSIAGISKTFDGNTKLSSIGYYGVVKGTDLKMNATLGGTAQDITRSTNSFTLDGVSLTVTGTTKAGDSPIKFTASNNVDDLYKKISDFVDAYNKIIDKANTYTSQAPYGLDSDAGTNTKYDPLTDDQKKEMTADEIKAWNDKAQQGLLQNDNALNTLLSNLQSAMETTVSSVGLTLNDIGISTAAYDYTSGGKLVINETTLKSKLKSDPEKVSELFTNADGVSARVKDVIVKNIGTYGNSGTLVDLAGSSTQIGVDNSQLATQISDYKKTITDLQTQMQSEQDRWQTKFTNMETAVYKLSSQMNYLNSMSSGS